MFLPNRSIEIHFDYINDGRCNAGAGIHKGVGLIGMNKGAILLPIEMFYKMLSHPEIWPWGGNPKKERRGGRHSEGMPINYDELIHQRKLLGRKAVPQPPVDPTRKIIAECCAEIVWSFLILHETVHICHGHVGYLQRTRNIPAILHVSRSPSPLSIFDLDFQSLELWADSKAVSVVLRGLLLKTHSSDLDSVFQTQMSKIFLWSFAIHSLFRLWGIAIDPSDLTGYTHPPTLLRLELALSAASVEIENEFPDLKGCFWEAIHDGQREAEKGFVYCGAEPITVDDLIGSKDPRVNDHCNALLDHHEKVLIEELKKYTFVSLDDPIKNSVTSAA